MSNQLKVDIIGTYPPPIGGTSIHLQRLHETCIRNNIVSRVFDTHGRTKQEYSSINIKPIVNYKKFYVTYLRDRCADIIHSHTHSWRERAMITLKARLCRQKSVFTFHSFRDEKIRLSLIEKACALYTIKSADYFIATSEGIRVKLIEWGVSEGKVSTISPFIIPDNDNVGELDDDLRVIKEKFKFIICANASNNDHYQGKDLYGLDMCVKLHSFLRTKYACGFVYILTKVTDKSYLAEMKEEIKEKGIEDSFYIIQHPVNFLALLKESKLFVRPTCTDSRPMSVDESIVLGCPAIASNVCWHPASCVLFEAGNQNDFNTKVLDVLNNYDEVLQAVSADYIENEAEKVFGVYRNLLMK